MAKTIVNKYSNTYDITQNKNYKFQWTKDVKLYAAHCARATLYLSGVRSGVLHVLWSDFGKYDEPNMESFISVYDFIPETDMDLQIFLYAYYSGTQSGVQSVSERTFEEDYQPLIMEISKLIDLKQDQAKEDFKNRLQDM
jgi:hypothetical protein